MEVRGKESEAYVESPKIPPRIRMAEAPPEKIPDNARRFAEMMRAAGFYVWITYGVSGEDKRLPSKGKCGHCGKVMNFVADGGLRVHDPAEKVQCKGTGHMPSGMKKVNGKCMECSREVPVLPNGTVGPHIARCPGSSQGPSETIPGKALEPDYSIAVRVKRFGTGCWVNGSYDFGGWVDFEAEKPYVHVCDWTEFNRKAKEVCARVHGERSALLLDVEPGK